LSIQPKTPISCVGIALACGWRVADGRRDQWESEQANQVDLGGSIVIKALCEARLEREMVNS